MTLIDPELVFAKLNLLSYITVTNIVEPLIINLYISENIWEIGWITQHEQ